MSGSPTTSQTYYDVYGNPASMLGDVYFNDAGIPMSGENRLYTSPTQGMELALNPSNSGWSSPYTADQYKSLGYQELTPYVWSYQNPSSMSWWGAQQYNQTDAEGFLRIMGLPGRVQGRVTPRSY